MPTDPDPAIPAAAWALAADLAGRAGIRIEPVETAPQAQAAADVLRDIWGGDPTALPGNAIRALAHAGNYTVSVHDERAGGRLIGASVAFFCAPPRRALHSHITGLLPSGRGRNAGTAVKLHQRAWALDAGLTTVTWTYDPLIARNAHFNLTKLGARPVHYLVDFYGEMADEINAGDQSDRFEVDWDITASWPPPAGGGTGQLLLDVGPGGEPVPTGDAAAAGAVEVAVPADMEAIRHASPTLAADWRVAVRETMLRLLDSGHRVTRFTGSGHYVLETDR